jgi:hypothetical protein
MKVSLKDALLFWLPADSRSGVVRRALIVWAVAPLIALMQWASRPLEHPLDSSLIYSFAISTCIWLLCDPVRIRLHRWLRAEPPHYWAWTPRSFAYMPACIFVGYVAGTALGDAYTGRSTWELMSLSPQRFWSFWLSSVGISFGFLFYFYQREKSQELKRQAGEARLKLLESQLEPHMLFNTLANLRVLIGTDPARATAMLDRLNDFLRATLTASRTEATAGRHTLTEEFARLRDYLELMAVRMGPRLQYTLELPEALASQPVPPLLLQPLVENCIRHGLEPSLQGGEVRVSARRQGQQLVLEVSDTGVGSAPTPTPGFGLSQVRERLATAYPGQAHMDWQGQAGGGTRAVLTLPLHTPTP